MHKEVPDDCSTVTLEDPKNTFPSTSFSWILSFNTMDRKFWTFMMDRRQCWSSLFGQRCEPNIKAPFLCSTMAELLASNDKKSASSYRRPTVLFNHSSLQRCAITNDGRKRLPVFLGRWESPNQRWVHWREQMQPLSRWGPSLLLSFPIPLSGSS